MAKDQGKMKMPQVIWKLPRNLLTWQEKHLLSLIWWTGYKGCHVWNGPLGERFGVEPRTVRRWLHNLKKADLIYIDFPKGRNRCIFSKMPPKNLKQTLLAKL